MIAAPLENRYEWLRKAEKNSWSTRKLEAKATGEVAKKLDTRKICNMQKLDTQQMHNLFYESGNSPVLELRHPLGAFGVLPAEAIVFQKPNIAVRFFGRPSTCRQPPGLLFLPYQLARGISRW